MPFACPAPRVLLLRRPPEQLDLNLLRVFDALLQEGGVTAAAERLHLSNRELRVAELERTFTIRINGVAATLVTAAAEATAAAAPGVTLRFVAEAARAPRPCATAR